MKIYCQLFSFQRCFLVLFPKYLIPRNLSHSTRQPPTHCLNYEQNITGVVHSFITIEKPGVINDKSISRRKISYLHPLHFYYWRVYHYHYHYQLDKGESAAWPINVFAKEMSNSLLRR